MDAGSKQHHKEVVLGPGRLNLQAQGQPSESITHCLHLDNLKLKGSKSVTMSVALAGCITTQGSWGYVLRTHASPFRVKTCNTGEM